MYSALLPPRAHSPQENMISHQTLYSLANSLGVLAMVTVVGYHFLAVNAKYLSKDAK
ncbi:hypothetical protein B0H15DRAFT_861420 [Mycena belliarum]|uniref:Dolichyl-diphosphooligosaccharide--protein glycosyltransferase subunit 4 n=1 Tax=Mycena belliarum TaxID=1033014 RepID=A0AAD6TSC5_9AGAR|nr:hypothetical protein B0H15DRAFT_861420 [Mycena belliae]